MLAKNRVYDVEITGLTSDGMGVGKHEGIPIFIKGAAPGDKLSAKVIKLERNHAYGRIEKIIEESPYREEPECPVYGKCGGCSLSHISYGAQVSAKEGKVLDSLRRIGGFADAKVDEVIDTQDPLRYRNKSVFPIRGSIGGAVCGLYAENSHRLVPVRDCLIAHPGVAAILRTVESYINTNHISTYDENTHTGLIRHVMVRTSATTGEVMVIVVATSHSLPHVDKLILGLNGKTGVCSICLNINPHKTNVIMGDETRVLWGESYINEVLFGTTFAISAPSFFQVNTAMTERLYGKVLELAGLTTHSDNDGKTRSGKPGQKTLVVDAYCGVGAISLLAAPYAENVIGIETEEAAVANAQTNAAFNGIVNTKFVVGKTEETLPKILQAGLMPGVLILDPPRKGCERTVIDAVRRSEIERIVYVSCDPATLARDLKLLCADGLYMINKVVVVDTFPQTSHVETAVLVTKAGAGHIM